MIETVLPGLSYSVTGQKNTRMPEITVREPGGESLPKTRVERIKAGTVNDPQALKDVEATIDKLLVKMNALLTKEGIV